MIKTIIKAYRYFRYPKYAIFKGIQIEDRAYFSMAKNLKQSGEYGRAYSVERFSLPYDGWKRSRDYELWKDNLFLRIWTFKQLIRVVRILKQKGYSETRHESFWKPIKEFSYENVDCDT